MSKKKSYNLYAVMRAYRPEVTVQLLDHGKLMVAIRKTAPFPRIRGGRITSSNVSYSGIAHHLAFQLWYAGSKLLYALPQLKQGPGRCIPTRVLVHDVPGGDWNREYNAHKLIALPAVRYLPEFRKNKNTGRRQTRYVTLRVAGGLSQWHLNALPVPLIFGRRGTDTINLAYDADSPWTRRYEILYDLAGAYEPMTRRALTVDRSGFDKFPGIV